jgi:hypothetical protein
MVNDFKPSVDSRTPVLTRHQPNLLFPDDDQFWFQTQRQFGAGEYGGSLFGEVLETVSRITSGDYESWHSAWNDIADRLADDGAEQLAREHRVSARDSFLRAFNYYRASEFFLHADESDGRIQRAYQRTVGSYQQAAALFDPPILPVEICASTSGTRSPAGSRSRSPAQPSSVSQRMMRHSRVSRRCSSITSPAPENSSGSPEQPVLASTAPKVQGDTPTHAYSTGSMTRSEREPHVTNRLGCMRIAVWDFSDAGADAIVEWFHPTRHHLIGACR